MNPLLANVMSLFVQKGWKVTSQTEHSASLEKKASSTVLAIVLGIFALLIFFANMVIGIIAIVAVLLLIALNNATKKSGTAQISILQNGTVQVSSNISSINGVYPPSESGNLVIKTS